MAYLVAVGALVVVGTAVVLHRERIVALYDLLTIEEDSERDAVLIRWDTVLVGKVTSVGIRSGTLTIAEQWIHGWVVTVSSMEVLHGPPLPRGGFQVFVHSPSMELGIDLNKPPKDTRIWALAWSGDGVSAWKDFDPSELEAFRKAARRRRARDLIEGR